MGKGTADKEEIPTVKRRTRLLITIGLALLATLVVAGAVLLRPPVPYRFLEEAAYEGTTLHTYHSGPVGASPSQTTAVLRFSINRPFAEVQRLFVAELPDAEGWQVEDVGFGSDEIGEYRSKSKFESVMCEASENGTTVYVEKPATVLDRIHAWLWKLSRR